MAIKFITSNPGKFAEAKAIIPDLEQLNIDLPEIQELDSRKIIEAKLEAALAHHPGPLMVEDLSLRIDCLGGLPGPLIKWFLATIGASGLADLVAKYDDRRAISSVLIGYAESKTEIHYFTGQVKGKIVTPRGQAGFGFDAIFQPDGHTETFAENPEIKDAIGHRRQALEKLKASLIA